MYPLLFSVAISLSGTQYQVEVLKPIPVVVQKKVVKVSPKPKTKNITTTTTVPILTGFKKAQSAVDKPASFIGSDGQFWCADLIGWLTGKEMDGPVKVQQRFPVTENPVQGDGVLIDLMHNSDVGHDPNFPTHVAVLDRIEGDTVFVIEGNGRSSTRVTESSWPKSAVIGYVSL